MVSISRRDRERSKVRTNTGERYITRQTRYVVSRRATGAPYICKSFSNLQDAIRYRDEMIGND